MVAAVVARAVCSACTVHDPATVHGCGAIRALMSGELHYPEYSEEQSAVLRHVGSQPRPHSRTRYVQ